MTITITVGMQWGDEGKGRMVDLLSEQADIVARFNGGDNAGHTVTVGRKTFKLHLVPSGIIHPGALCVLGSGMVIYPPTLLKEIEDLAVAGIEVSPRRMAISHAAHLITPAHRMLDQAQELARSQGQRIGTTGRGIGPAYVDKAARSGLRAGEVLDETHFRSRLLAHLHAASFHIQALYGQPALAVEALAEEYIAQALKLAPFIQDTGQMLRQALGDGKRVLAEAAQGSLLDLDSGTYPYVTSSCTTAAGAFSGLGIGIRPVERILGISKAFQTRVGAGPFPTELSGEMAERLRGTGANPWDEFGTTTGRPRRVGWLDGVLLRYTVAINGATELALTKLDILSGLPQLKICTAYRVGAQEVQEPPAWGGLDACQPVYEELPGWLEDVTGVRSWADLPTAAQAYIRRVEEIAGAPVTIISVGPERSQVIFR